MSNSFGNGRLVVVEEVTASTNIYGFHRVCTLCSFLLFVTIVIIAVYITQYFTSMFLISRYSMY